MEAQGEVPETCGVTKNFLRPCHTKYFSSRDMTNPSRCNVYPNGTLPRRKLLDGVYIEVGS